jgi:hypothetical protein
MFVGCQVYGSQAPDSPDSGEVISTADAAPPCVPTEKIDRWCDDFNRSTPAPTNWSRFDSSGGGGLAIVPEGSGGSLRINFPELPSGSNASAYLTRRLRPNQTRLRFALRIRRTSTSSNNRVALFAVQLERNRVDLYVDPDKCVLKDGFGSVDVTVQTPLGTWFTLSGSVTYDGETVALSVSLNGGEPLTVKGQANVKSSSNPELVLGSTNESGPDSANELHVDDFSFESE